MNLISSFLMTPEKASDQLMMVLMPLPSLSMTRRSVKFSQIKIACTRSTRIFLLEQIQARICSKRNMAEEEDYENYEDEEDNETSAPRQTALLMPKAREIKPNPYEKMTIDQILTSVGKEKSLDIYAFTELYLPTTKENRANVHKYMYKNLIRNPKDILKQNKEKQEKEVTFFEKEILRIFKMMYEQKFSTKKLKSSLQKSLKQMFQS